MSKHLMPSQRWMDRVSALTSRIAGRDEAPAKRLKTAKALRGAGLGAKAAARGICLAEGGHAAAERCAAELPDLRVAQHKGDDAPASEWKDKVQPPRPRAAASSPAPASPRAVRQQQATKKAPAKKPAPTSSPRPAPAPPVRVAARKAARRPACGVGPECSFGLLGGTCGTPAVLFLPGPSGPERQPARYCLAEAQKLIPSHNPLNGFRPNPGYPVDTQERVYDTDKAEQLKVLKIGKKLEPAIVFQPSTDGINGPPISTEDGIVLGGNGRAQGLQVHYADGGTSAREYLLKHAAVYGFRRADVEKLTAPVVVRVVRVGKDPKVLAALVRKLNIPLTQGMDARAAAVGEARRLSDEVLQVLGRELDDATTLSDYLSSPRSRDLVAALRRSEVLTDRNASQCLTESGLLTDDGRTLVERLLAARLIPDARLLDDLGPQLRATLARGAPYLLAAAGWGAEWDLSPALRAAARDLVRLRQQEAHSVSEYLRQESLIKTERPAVEGVAHGRQLLELLHQLGGKPLQFSKFARAYAHLAQQNPTGQGGLFAAEKVTPGDAIKQAARAAGVTLP